MQNAPVVPNEPIDFESLNPGNRVVLVALDFAKVLIEDLGGANLDDKKLTTVNNTLKLNLPLFVQLCRRVLENPDSEDAVSLGLDAVGGWTFYFMNSKLDFSELRPFAVYLIQFLHSDSDEIFQASTKLITELLTSYKAFWVPEAKQEIMKYLLEQGTYIDSADFDEDSSEDTKLSSFCKLLLAFCDNCRLQFLMNPSPEFSRLQMMIKTLTAIPGVPVVQDSLAVETLEYWTSFTEDLGCLETHHQEYIDLLRDIVGIYWRKMRLPSAEVYSSWTPDSRDGFLSFRRDVMDLLELVYPFMGRDLIVQLVDSVTTTIHRAPDDMWEEIECSLYCLSGLAYLVEESEYDQLKLMFDSPLLGDLLKCDIPRVRQTVVNLIGSFDSFFEKPIGQPYLSQALEYLFQSLSNLKLSLVASRSIQKLCSSSRKYLTPALPTFINIYTSMSLPIMENKAHERTVCAIANVIQALDDIEEKSRYTGQLIGMIVAQIEEQAADTANDEIIERIASLVRCIVNTGRGLQVPEEVHDVHQNLYIQLNEFWASDRDQIRQRVLQVIRVLAIELEPYNQLSDICQSCCDIFKAGLREVVPGPFSFPVSNMVDFIKSKYQLGPPSVYSTLVDLANCVVTSLSFGKNSTTPSIVESVVISFLEEFFSENDVAVSSEYEPDMQTSRLQLMLQIVKHQLNLFLSHRHIELMSEFACHMMGSQERFVIRAACAFWTQFISQSPQDPQTSERHMVLFRAVGPQLTAIICQKITGDAVRSDLDYYVDVIKKMVFKHPMLSREWFHKYLVDEPTTPAVGRRDQKSSEDFIAKLFHLRGSRETKMVVKDFWLGCRGITDYS
uniref:ARAD1D43736p n=1 Tax=Blastobotrys adeninivorans TaxID=409370 RepID=A0A060TCL7_BLAAD